MKELIKEYITKTIPLTKTQEKSLREISKDGHVIFIGPTSSSWSQRQVFIGGMDFNPKKNKDAYEATMKFIRNKMNSDSLEKNSFDSTVDPIPFLKKGLTTKLSINDMIKRAEQVVGEDCAPTPGIPTTPKNINMVKTSTKQILTKLLNKTPTWTPYTDHGLSNEGSYNCASQSS